MDVRSDILRYIYSYSIATLFHIHSFLTAASDIIALCGVFHDNFSVC